MNDSDDDPLSRVKRLMTEEGFGHCEWSTLRSTLKDVPSPRVEQELKNLGFDVFVGTRYIRGGAQVLKRNDWLPLAILTCAAILSGTLLILGVVKLFELTTQFPW